MHQKSRWEMLNRFWRGTWKERPCVSCHNDNDYTSKLNTKNPYTSELCISFKGPLRPIKRITSGTNRSSLQTRSFENDAAWSWLPVSSFCLLKSQGYTKGKELHGTRNSSIHSTPSPKDADGQLTGQLPDEFLTAHQWGLWSPTCSLSKANS